MDLPQANQSRKRHGGGNDLFYLLTQYTRLSLTLGQPGQETLSEELYPCL